MYAVRRDHRWPPYESPFGFVPEGVRYFTGSIQVPADLLPGVLMWLEARFRQLLWPPCRTDGYQRLAREFVWSNDGWTLHFRIVDIPDNRQS